MEWLSLLRPSSQENGRTVPRSTPTAFDATPISLVDDVTCDSLDCFDSSLVAFAVLNLVAEGASALIRGWHIFDLLIFIAFTCHSQDITWAGHQSHSMVQWL
jgi:hypothetical protein